MKRVKNILSMLISGIIPDKFFNTYVSCREKLIVYVDMDGTAFDYKSQKKEFIKNHPDIEYPQSIPGFFHTMKPIDNSISVINRLIKSDKFDVYFLTAPSVENHLSYSEKRTCIESHFGLDACRNLIISNDKSLSIGDILIDDCKEGRGQEHFLGKHFVFDSNWKEIENLVFKK